MTVCIAGICEPVVSGEEYIISATDRMVSMSGYFSGDNAVRKIDPVAYGWMSMMAGNDVSPAIPILAQLKDIRQAHSYADTLKSMSAAFKSVYKAQRLEQIEDELLAPLGFTWETFRSEARDQLSDATFAKLVEQIRTFELDLSFLVAGTDSSGTSHIFSISNPGKCDYYDKLGFWAIGSGQHQALASMFACGYSRHNDLATCIAQVLAAKFSAESASGVGKSTWLLVERSHIPNRSMRLDTDQIEQFRAHWNAMPKIPYGALGAIEDAMKEEKARVELQEKEDEHAEAAKQLAAQTSAGQP